MRPSEALAIHRDQVIGIAAARGARGVRVFGSVVKGMDREGSDLDLLVDPAPKTSLLDIAGLQIEIEARIGVKVDLLTPKCLPLKFRQRVLEEALPV